MIKENIYVAINRNDEIQWVQGSSKKTRYFKTDRYLKGAVEYHNKYHPDDIWKVRKCVILEDEPTISKMEQVDEPQTETSTNSEKVQLKVQLTDEPQTYITEDRDTQILDAWQVYNRNTTSAVEDEPQTERSE